MAEHAPSGPPELGAEMDYPQHRKTYSTFVSMTKYAIVSIAALLIAMAFGFFAGGGFISSLIVFLILCAVGFYAAR